jgi:uncharacterized membrane protein
MTLAPGALAVTLGASLAWSGFDSLRKALVRRLAPLPLLFLLTAASLPALAIWAAVDGRVALGTLPPGYLAPALASIVLSVVSNLAFVEALRRAPLSSTVPLLSLTPVFSALLAIPLLGELPTPVTALGILLVVIGAFWLQSRPAPSRPSLQAGAMPAGDPAGASAAGGAAWRDPASRAERADDSATPGTPAPREHGCGIPRRDRTRRGFRSRGLRSRGLRSRRGFLSPRFLILFVAFSWSLTITLDKLAVSRSTAPFHGLVLNTGVTLGLLAVLAARRRLGEVAGVTRAPGLFVLAVGVSTLALALQLLALSLVWVSWVETMKRGIGNLMAVVLGRLAFGEAVTAAKLLAVGLMAAGVALILI